MKAVAPQQPSKLENNRVTLSKFGGERDSHQESHPPLGSRPFPDVHGFKRVPSRAHSQKSSKTYDLKKKKEIEKREDAGSGNRRSSPGERQRGSLEDGQRGTQEAAEQRPPRGRREGSEKASHGHARGALGAGGV